MGNDSRVGFSVILIPSIGSAIPIQATLFGKFMEGFSKELTMGEFIKRQNFWALMFFVLAIAVAFFYFLMGSAFTTLTHVRLPPFSLFLLSVRSTNKFST